MKVLFAILLLIFSLHLNAEHQHHDYVGFHGMMLSVIEEEVIVYHLPLYRPPHDYQLMYRVLLPPKLKKSLKNKSLVTILPEKFDLNLLISGQTIKLKTKVFDGHFERGGKLLTEVDLQFDTLLYKRQLGKSFEQEVFDSLVLSNGIQLLVHRINARPSFDFIIKRTKSEKLKETNCRRMIGSELNQTLVIEEMKHCISGELVYSEFLDFQ